MWANMFLLFWLSLIPVVTEWLRDEYHEPLPAASFGIVGLAAAFAYFLLVHAIIRANGRDSLVGAAIDSDFKGTPRSWGTRPAWSWRTSTCGSPTRSMPGVAVTRMVPDRRITHNTSGSGGA